jgi:hypothetical protein
MRYIGNGHYCYANVTAMLLASVGKRVEPGMIEVLSGVGIGAHWLEAGDLIFFDSAAPDRGISTALELLGFAVQEHASADGDPPPWSALSDALATGPAILGPVDIGLLTHKPGRGRPSGIDHYVLAYAIDDAEVFYHDPAGYPYVSMPRDALAEAWHGALIGYRRGAYRWWAAPQRVAHPTDAELLPGLLLTLERHYQQTEARVPEGAGGVAIRRLAERVRAGRPPEPLYGHLVSFALQVAARRAGDFAAYFNGRGNHDQRVLVLAALKLEQAALFGRCHTLLVRQEWPAAADSLTLLAATEDQVRAQVSALAR